jgi:hypothetical protein
MKGKLETKTEYVTEVIGEVLAITMKFEGIKPVRSGSAFIIEVDDNKVEAYINSKEFDKESDQLGKLSDKLSHLIPKSSGIASGATRVRLSQEEKTWIKEQANAGKSGKLIMTEFEKQFGRSCSYPTITKAMK